MSKKILFSILGAILGIPLSYYFQNEMVKSKCGGIGGYLEKFDEISKNDNLFSNVIMAVVVFAIIGAIIGYFIDNSQNNNISKEPIKNSNIEPKKVDYEKIGKNIGSNLASLKNRIYLFFNTKFLGISLKKYLLFLIIVIPIYYAYNYSIYYYNNEYGFENATRENFTISFLNGVWKWENCNSDCRQIEFNGVENSINESEPNYSSSFYNIVNGQPEIYSGKIIYMYQGNYCLGDINNPYRDNHPIRFKRKNGKLLIQPFADNEIFEKDLKTSSYLNKAISTEQPVDVYSSNSNNESPIGYFVLADESNPVHFYEQPDYDTKKSARFTTSEFVEVLKIKNDFGYVLFTNSNNQTSSGWIPMNKLEEVWDAL